MYKKPHKRKKLQSSTVTQDPPPVPRILLFSRYNYPVLVTLGSLITLSKVKHMLQQSGNLIFCNNFL